MTLFFDLDGTLLHTVSRHYSLYREILSGWGKATLSQRKYWRLKRTGATTEDVLRQTQAVDRASDFRRLWRVGIEAPANLQRDRVVPGAIAMLSRLATRHALVLVSLRRSHDAFLDQIRSLRLEPLFRETLCAGETNGDWQVKAALIGNRFTHPAGWMVGDTEADVLAGQAVGLKTCAVTWGIRSREFLERYAPDAIVDELAGVVDTLETKNRSHTNRY